VPCGRRRGASSAPGAMQDREAIDVLLDRMLEVRRKIAENAGFDNYRDYMHQAKGRFDYTPDRLFRLS
jgi:oligoendopeptidase F